MATSWGGRAKPSHAAAIRPGSKLAQGLKQFFCYPTANSLFDSVAPANVLVTNGNGTATVVNTEAGPGLSGTAGTVQVPNSFNFAAGDFTIQYVFRPDAFNGANGEFLSKNLEFDLFYNTSGNINLLTLGGTGVSSLSSSAGLVIGSVYVLHITRSGTAGLCYTNGRKDGSFTSSATTAGGQALKINGDGSRGAVPSSTFISLAYWNRALSASEVAELGMDPYLPLRPLRSRFASSASFLAAWAARNNQVIAGGSYVS